MPTASPTDIGAPAAVGGPTAGESATTGKEPAGLNRRERRTIETRQAITAAARELFEADGYAETTVDQIAERANVATRTFFRYFPTKETLLFADFDEVRSEMLTRLENSPADEDLFQSLSRELRAMADVVDERRDDLVWGFRMCPDNDAVGVYERTVLKERSYRRVADFIAGRLGVDPEVDPRPMTWAMTIMGVFGSALKAGPSDGDEQHGSSHRFDELLTSTAHAMQSMTAEPQR